jgi:thiol-disulfide isomerase/thioredoxin
VAPFSPFSSPFFAVSADFWTTKCTRCPDALDKLDKMAQDPQYANVQFISICCDNCDGAREIIDKETERRWQHVSHYFMEPGDKEKAKKILGFKAVPFYVVVNAQGEITQMGGSKKIDFERIPGKIHLVQNKENARPEDPVDDKLEQQQPLGERAFVLDELDF